MAGNDVAIVGAGLAGLALALTLATHSIPSTIYESRPPGTRLGGAIMLSPNALRVLSSLGALPLLRPHGFAFSTLHFRTVAGEDKGTYCFGDEARFGYDALRVYRQDLVNVLLGLVKGRKEVRVCWDTKVEGVVSEGDGGVVLALSRGHGEEKERDEATHALVVGADGIHSTLRANVVAPGAHPRYLGQTAICGAVAAADVPLDPARFPLPVSLAGAPGVFVLAPQDPAGGELLVGTQYAVPELSHAERRKVDGDPEAMMKMLRRDEGAWGSEVVSAAMRGVRRESMYIWQFFEVPKVGEWRSPGRRVLLIGDAAHALPPTLGQGANQALEEGRGLGLLIARVGVRGEFGDEVERWVQGRKERIERLGEMTRKMNNRRLPEEERTALGKGEVWEGDQERPGEEMRWLYGYDVEAEVERACVG